MRSFLVKNTFFGLCALGLALSVSAGELQGGGVLGGVRLPTLFAAECQAIPYAPVDVFDAPEGLRIGQLVLDHPEYARKTTTACSFRPAARLKPEGLGNLLPVQVGEVGYEEPALVAYQVQTRNNQLWVQGHSNTGAFWLPVQRGAQYVSLEQDLVQGLARFSETCDQWGRCTPVADNVQRLAAHAGEERADSCYGNAYDIEGVVTLPDGRRAYRVRLAETLEPKYADKLPLQALVPTYDYQRRWTGFFYSRGC